MAAEAATACDFISDNLNVFKFDFQVLPTGYCIKTVTPTFA